MLKNIGRKRNNMNKKINMGGKGKDIILGMV